MMKRIFLLLLISCISLQLSAQSFSVVAVINASQCNGTNNGSIHTTVTALHPPCSFSWNTGDTLANLDHLAPGTYVLTVTDSIGNDSVLAFQLTERPCPLAAEPFFTPNDDGINDTWTISNLTYYPDYRLLIYNRWGQKVYETSGENSMWDGKDLFHRPVPEGAYYYLLYPDKETKEELQKGSVSIIR